MSTSDALTGAAEIRLQAEHELRERLGFETFLADLAIRFQRLPADELDAAIGESLRGLVETLDVDRSSIVELSEDGTSHGITHGYARPGVRPPEYGLELRPFPGTPNRCDLGGCSCCLASPRAFRRRRGRSFRMSRARA